VLEEEVTPWAWGVCQWLALHLRDQWDGAAGGHLDGSGLDGRVEEDGCYYLAGLELLGEDGLDPLSNI